MADNTSPSSIAVTMGEPAGIGTELLLRAYAHFAELPPGKGPSFFLLDDPFRVEKLARKLGADVSIQTISAPEEAPALFAKGLPVLPLSSAAMTSIAGITMGTPSAKTASAVIESIETAVKLVTNQKAAALVTLPIQKQTLQETGFDFAGHTDFLGSLTKDAPLPEGGVRGAVMMLTAGPFRVVPVTVHIPLANVAHILTQDMIVETGLITAQALARDYGIKSPRLAVAGLNPHAGEGGHMGHEELNIITPAIQKLRDLGIEAVGPLPADTMFHEEARSHYHAALTMYHDQALIPIKTVAFYAAINITLGLPIVRTSPDHGTALALVGKGKARPDSLMNAIYAAHRAAAARQNFDKNHAG